MLACLFIYFLKVLLLLLLLPSTRQFALLQQNKRRSAPNNAHDEMDCVHCDTTSSMARWRWQARGRAGGRAGGHADEPPQRQIARTRAQTTNVTACIDSRSARSEREERILLNSALLAEFTATCSPVKAVSQPASQQAGEPARHHVNTCRIYRARAQRGPTCYRLHTLGDGNLWNSGERWRPKGVGTMPFILSDTIGLSDS